MLIFHNILVMYYVNGMFQSKQLQYITFFQESLHIITTTLLALLL